MSVCKSLGWTYYTLYAHTNLDVRPLSRRRPPDTNAILHIMYTFDLCLIFSTPTEMSCCTENHAAELILEIMLVIRWRFAYRINHIYWVGILQTHSNNCYCLSTISCDPNAKRFRTQRPVCHLPSCQLPPFQQPQTDRSVVGCAAINFLGWSVGGVCSLGVFSVFVAHCATIRRNSFRRWE